MGNKKAEQLSLELMDIIQEYTGHSVSTSEVVGVLNGLSFFLLAQQLKTAESINETGIDESPLSDEEKAELKKRIDDLVDKHT